MKPRYNLPVPSMRRAFHIAASALIAAMAGAVSLVLALLAGAR